MVDEIHAFSFYFVPIVNIRNRLLSHFEDEENDREMTQGSTDVRITACT